jgi:TonB family protein
MSDIEQNKSAGTSNDKRLKDWVAVFKMAEDGGREISLRLQKPRLVIGSVESADIRLGGDGVAPIHAVLELTREGNPEGFLEPMLFDLASDTGVRVNGGTVVTGALKHGDIIEIGRHRLAFSMSRLDHVDPPIMVRAGNEKLFRREDEDFSSLLSEEPPETAIFDYSVANQMALEVVMSWRGLILDIEHFVDQKQIRVGDSRKSDFGIPAVLSSNTHVLVSNTGGQYQLHIDPKMKGVLHRQGRLERVESLTSSAIPFGQSEFAKVSAGEVDFYLAFTSAPPKLRPGSDRRRDPFFVRTMALSLLFTGAFFFLVSRLGIPQQIEAEQLPERIATILYQPEKYSVPVPKVRVDKSKPENAVPEPKKPEEPKVTKIDLRPDPNNANKPIPKEMNVAQNTPAGGPKQSVSQNRAKEGEGARAKGVEGRRGQKTGAPGKTSQELAKRPSPNGGDGIGGGGNSEAAGIGNVDLMKGATDKIQDLLGNSAARLGKDGSKLQGFGGFTTRGTGGQALSGSGQGGGGDADTLAGGLGKKNMGGGGRVGTGLGAAGDGSGIIGGKTRVVIRSGGPEEAVVMGAIDASAIEAALLAHKDEFRLCYEREINAENPKLSGRVGTSFVIGAQGKVTQAGIASTSLNNANAERCILNVIRRVDFPIPRGGGIVQVTYPFKFAPAGG